MKCRSIAKRLLILSILIVLHNCSWDTKDQRIPRWVPREAVDSARVYLKRWSGFYEKHAKKNYLVEDIEKFEKSQLYLKYAWENVRVDYLEYSEGDRIQDHFFTHDTTGANLMSVGFGVYYQDNSLGTIGVLFKSDSTWTWSGTGVNSFDWEDCFAAVCRAYPHSQGFKVYKYRNGRCYFPEKDGEISEILECWKSEGGVFTQIYDPVLFMAEEKQKAIKFLEWRQIIEDNPPK